MMRLQTLRIPDREELNKIFTSGNRDLSEELTEVQKLYWRGKEGFSVAQSSEGPVLTMSQGTVVGMNTYFNSFSCGKWREYTTVKSVWFCLEGKGRFLVSLYYAVQNGEKAFKIKIMDAELDMLTTGSCRVGPVNLLKYSEGSIYAVIRAIMPSRLTGGGWETNQPIKNSIHLCVIMCTYKKELYVKRNLEVLKGLLEERKEWNKEGVLSAVCIVDNGRTLPDPQIPGVYIIPNKNTGGSGGFTRGMRAILDGELGVSTEFTHLLLMDDDVVIEPEAVCRMKAFLSYEKEDYRMRLLGGAMLRLDYPYIQHEAGGVWNHGMIHSVHQGLDLRSMSNVLRNEQREKMRADYVAWWYCCIPVLYARKYGMPMPFFLHCDDIEYSLRGKEEPIYLNGIAVWHEQFENKRYSAIEYYDVRNMLFTNALHCPEYKKEDLIFSILYKVYANLMRYRYKDAELVLMAVEDYRKGVNWLRKVDAEKLHKEIIKRGYQFKKVKIYKQNINKNKLYNNKNNNLLKVVLSITFGGYFMPVLHNKIDYIETGSPLKDYFRKSRVCIYDPNTQMGFYEKRNYNTFIKIIIKTIKILKTI